MTTNTDTHGGGVDAVRGKFVPDDATPAMIAAALAVDWTNESEEATAHNVWHAMLAASPAAPAAAAGVDVREALKALLDHVDVETCVHEETHRGGFLWTICDQCGRKWADDEGGFVPHADAPAVARARMICEALAAPDAKER